MEMKTKIDYFENLEIPFLIDIEEKEEYNYNDYIEIQKKLQEKNLDTFFEYLYPTEFTMKTSYDDLKRRCSKGFEQKILDVSNNILPNKQLFKIGNGGNGKNCFVCCKPLFVKRYNSPETILQSLEEVGFNGHFLLLEGGFPNPTGIEMKYICVPYCFKIFMMLEAKKMGFENVIWLDAVCYAVNNPERLFEIIQEDDAIFRTFPPNCFEQESMKNCIFPKTIDLLNNLVNRDITNDININSIVFGLNLTSSKILQFIYEYYEMVKIGLPFLSYFPEEMVFTSIFNKDEFKYIFKNRNEMYRLYINNAYISKEQAKKDGYFFMQRNL
jgi:hypothetical protein